MNRALACCCLCVILATPVLGQELLVVAGSQSPVYDELVQALREQAPEAVTVVRHEPSQALRLSPDLWVVAAGVEAAQYLLNRAPDCVCMCALVPATAYAARIASHPAAAPLLRQARLSAVFLDQSPRRQVLLARAVAGPTARLGALADVNAAPDAQALADAAAALGQPFRLHRLQPGGDATAAIGALFAEVDVVLTVPAGYVFDPVTAERLLTLSYSSGKPLLGFTPEYVRAGAFAAVHSEPAEVARQLLDAFASWQQQGRLPPAAYPREVAVSVNPGAARSLHLSHFNAESLEASLLQLEGEREPQH